jgi:hypothetical protein
LRPSRLLVVVSDWSALQNSHKMAGIRLASIGSGTYKVVRR